MKYIFNNKEFRTEWNRWVPRFKAIDDNNVQLDPYANVDWKTAEKPTFIEMYWPRSEVGAIYGNEALFLLEACLFEEPKTIMEIGRMNGTSTKLFAAIAERMDGQVISIDGAPSEGVALKLDILNLRNRVNLMETWSPWLAPEDWDIDFLFIDGDHSLMSIIIDYHYFNYFVKEGGLIAFHDIDLADTRRAIDIIRERDQLEHIADVARVRMFRKLTPRKERYFEVLLKQEERRPNV